MQNRVYNFGPGPATLPLPVLEEAQRDLVSLPGVGMSVLEISHRSKHFAKIMETAIANIRKLLQLPEDYEILFLQGGARLQFALVPMNFLNGSKPADYIVTGSWGKMAVAQARELGEAHAIWNGEKESFVRLPKQDEFTVNPRAAYVHFTSNETIQGLQFPKEPDAGKVPLICDCSSDFLSRPIDVPRYGMIYAGAQKNAGPAGVTIVILRKDLLQQAREDIPQMLSYRAHAEAGCLLNTPPVFAVYMVKLVTDWLVRDIGGLDKMAEINKKKANLLYDVIDQSGGFYQGCVQPEGRSLMNVTFRLDSAELEKSFLDQAQARGLCELKGHRSVGGIRASIYNAMPTEGVSELRDFMQEFTEQNTR